MPRPEKVQAVEEIAQRFDEADAVFLTEYRGLSVGEQQRLRRALRDAGASYKVLKMSLTRRALEGRPEAELSEWLVGPTAIAFVEGDPVAAAKALNDFAGEHDALVVKAGALNGQILPPEMVAKLARIESREVLLAKIAGAAQAPMAKLAGMLASFTRDAASMFSQLLEKKETEAPAAPEEAPAPAEEIEEAAASDEEAGPEAEAAAQDVADDAAGDGAAAAEASGDASQTETDGDGESAAEEE